jgi:hypothetical protein
MSACLTFGDVSELMYDEKETSSKIAAALTKLEIPFTTGWAINTKHGERFAESLRSQKFENWTNTFDVSKRIRHADLWMGAYPKFIQYESIMNADLKYLAPK